MSTIDHRADTALGIGQAIEAEVGSWPGVSTHPHRFGGVEFRYGKVELGHLHGDRLADLPFPRALRDDLVAQGRALPHHVLPSSGWVSRPIRGPQDTDDVIGLFRLNYDRLQRRKKTEEASLPSAEPRGGTTPSASPG